MPADDPAQRQPDIVPARDALKWEPKVQLDEGMKKTIEYFEAMLERLSSNEPNRSYV